MKLVKACVLAFSMYSKIPMPQLSWEEDAMQYVLCFFPWVGSVIGACVVGWSFLCQRFRIGSTAYLLITAAIPLLLTGGFHADGFLDTADALASYQSRERKLEILKDSHIGAFSVIMLLTYYLVYLAALSEIRGREGVLAVGLGFVLSRCLSGIAAVTFPNAKRDGMLRACTDKARKKAVLPALCIQSALCAGVLVSAAGSAGLLACLGAGVSFLFYYVQTKRQFGGITGDTAGYFVLLCEAAVAVCAAVGGRL